MAGCNRMSELTAAAVEENNYDERDYWWNLMEKATPPMHPSPNISEVIFKNKEGSDWDYDTFGHGG